jgi:hypothetical protein
MVMYHILNQSKMTKEDKITQNQLLDLMRKIDEVIENKSFTGVYCAESFLLDAYVGIEISYYTFLKEVKSK